MRQGNNSLAYNLYFNEDQKVIHIQNYLLKIITVDSGKLECAYVRN